MSNLVINDDFGPLAELMEQAESSPDHESLQQCEALILERIRAEVAARSDGIRRGIVFYEKLAEDAKRVYKMAEARAQRIRAYVKAEMEAAGIKKIQTPTGSLTVRGNGGIEPLTIYDEAQIPESFRDITITMPLDLWMKTGTAAFAGCELKTSAPSASNSRIREVLAKPCEDCDGTGKTNAGNCPECESDEFSTSPYDFGVDPETGYRDSGVRANCSKCGHNADIEDFMRKVNCTSCCGSGKQQVPGARLEPRGTSLVVK